MDTPHWNDDLKKIIEQGGTNHKFKWIDGCACKMTRAFLIGSKLWIFLLYYVDNTIVLKTIKEKTSVAITPI